MTVQKAADPKFLDYLVNGCPVPYQRLMEMILFLEPEEEKRRRSLQQYSFEQFLEEMRTGTPFGQRAYDRLYRLCDDHYQK